MISLWIALTGVSSSFKEVKGACVAADNRRLTFNDDDQIYYDGCAARTHAYLPEETRDYAEQLGCTGSFPMFGESGNTCSRSADQGKTVTDQRCGTDGQCRWMYHGVCGDYPNPGGGVAEVVPDRSIMSPVAGARTDPIDCGEAAQNLSRTDGVEENGWVQVHGLPMHYNKATGGNPITWEHRFISTLQCDLSHDDCEDPRQSHPGADFSYLPEGIGTWKGWRPECVPHTTGNHSSHRGGIPTTAEGWDADCASAWQRAYRAAFNFASQYIGSKCEIVGAYETTWMFVTFWIRPKAAREAYEANPLATAGAGLSFRPCYHSPLTSVQQLDEHRTTFSNDCDLIQSNEPCNNAKSHETGIRCSWSEPDGKCYGAMQQGCAIGRDTVHYMEHWVCKRPTSSGAPLDGGEPSNGGETLPTTDGKCEPWCGSNSNDWTAKCAFSDKSCSSCPQCSPEHSDGEQPETKCEGWCPSNTNKDKCSWSDCSGCEDCQRAHRQPDLKCEAWCPVSSNKAKCDWSDCSACEDCQRAHSGPLAIHVRPHLTFLARDVHNS